MVLISLFSCLAFAGCVAQEYGSRPERELFADTNRERQAQGLPTLRWNAALAEAARQHVQMMAERQTISHQFPGEASLPARCSKAGVSFMDALFRAPRQYSRWQHGFRRHRCGGAGR
jgi:hypothetical protein